MPSASAKLEKQASQEGSDPYKQVLTMIDHKRRNLEKRKAKLEGYRTEQKNGKELKGEQLAAVAKYGEVCSSLEFAMDLAKSVQALSTDHTKMLKKQQRKDQLERTQNDLSRIREILVIQDVMHNMGNETIREDFLAGRDGASKVTPEELGQLDELYPILTPKREEGVLFVKQVATAAEHLLFMMEDRNKELFGSTYATLHELVQRINSSGYFDKNLQKLSSEVPQVEGNCTEKVNEAPLVDPAIIEKEIAATPANLPPQNMPPQPMETQVMVSALPVVADAASYFSASVVPPIANAAAYPIPQQVIAPVPVQLRQQQRPIAEVIGQANSSFNFLQESQLEMETPSPPNVDLAVMLQFPPGTLPAGRNPPSAPAASAVPQPDFHQTIPTQTFTNQSFTVIPQQGAIPVPVTATASVPTAHIPAAFSQQTPVQGAAPYMTNVEPPPPIPMPPRAMQDEQAKMITQTSTAVAPVPPPSFAQATYSSQAQAPKPQNYVTSGAPPGFQPQQKVHVQGPPHMHQVKQQHHQVQSQFQPIPSLEQAAEQDRVDEQANWADGGAEADDFSSGGRQGVFRGRGNRGGRGRGSGYSGRGRGQQNGGGRSGGGYQSRGNPDGVERGYENGVSSQRDYNQPNQREYIGNFKRGGGGPPRDRDGPPSRGGQGYRGGSGAPFRGNSSNRMRGSNNSNSGGPRPQQVKQ